MSTQKKRKKLHIKKGDTVMVISGDYKGVTGEVLEVIPSKSTVIVDGVNVRKKHMKPSNDQPGGINEINAPILTSKVLLIDPKSGEATRIGRKSMDGKSVRYSKKSGEIIA